MAQINYTDGSRVDLDETVYYDSTKNELKFAGTDENKARVAGRTAKPKFIIGDGRGPVVKDGTPTKYQCSVEGDASVVFTLSTYEAEN